MQGGGVVTTQRNAAEVDRIIGTVERAFGRARQLPPLELGRDERLRRSRRGAVPVVLGMLLAAAAGIVMAVTWIGGGRRVHPSPPAEVVVSALPIAAPPLVPVRPPVPAAASAGKASVARPLHTAHAPAAAHRHARRSRHRYARPAWHAPKAPARPAIAPVNEARSRALAEDRILTRKLNQAELRRLRARR